MFESETTSVIRDAEIEDVLTEMAQDVFKVAKLDPKSAKIYVVNDMSINAFTIGNGHIFINAGLILKFSDSDAIIGVICHETGHIAAGHITRHINVLQQRSKNLTLATLAGILGVALTGSEDAMAILLGYAMIDERFYLRFSRGEEFAADALAASYMNKLGFGIDGLVKTFQIFKELEIMGGVSMLPTYIRSHPKSDDRIAAIAKKTNQKTNLSIKTWQEKYNRIRIKLTAFLNNEPASWCKHNDYYKAIQFSKIGRRQDAINLLRKIITRSPNDKYYKETLAQLLYENGNLNDSIKIYSQIINSKCNVLSQIDYANVLIEANQNIDRAIRILESAKYTEKFDSSIYRLLAKAYGKQKKIGIASLMLAYEQMLLHNYPMAINFVKMSLSKLNPSYEKSYIEKAKYLQTALERSNK